MVMILITSVTSWPCVNSSQGANHTADSAQPQLLPLLPAAPKS